MQAIVVHEITRDGAFLWGSPTDDFLQSNLTFGTTDFNPSTCHVNEASGQLIMLALQHRNLLILNQFLMKVVT
jgi:hypothetical protein